MNDENPCEEFRRHLWTEEAISYMYGPDFERETINELEKETMLTKLDTQDKALNAVKTNNTSLVP